MKVKIRVPATTANLGPGFDVFGAAIKLYNDITFETVDYPVFSVDVSGEGAGVLPEDKSNIVFPAINGFIKEFAPASFKRTSGFKIRMKNNVPITRGLGSSASVRVAAVVAVNKILGDVVPQDDLLKFLTKLEGHPDNVVPALVGGFCVIAVSGGKINYIKHKVPADIRAVVCIPEFEISTKKARSILPRSVPFFDAVSNCSRAGIFVSALLSRRYEFLSFAMQDKLHQPYRAKLVPGMENVFAAAMKSGALGAALSGSGPAILAVSGRDGRKNNRIGSAMQSAFRKRSINSRYIVVDFDNRGVRCEAQE
ncbi:MAG: homoserine kinase [Elusimicrobiota bacterium]